MTDLEPYTDYPKFPASQMLERAQHFHSLLSRRRTIRDFSPRPIPEGVLEECLRAAGRAPSGANHQPWHFVVVRSPEIKAEIRRAAEQEEQAFYGGRAPQDWLDALAPLGTDQNKPFLETAPALIAIFGENYSLDSAGGKVKNYYVSESVGIATGFLIAALNNAGLCSLTHTPSPMKFLNQILNRPKRERPFLLLVVGFPAEGVQVPRIQKKSLDEIASFF